MDTKPLWQEDVQLPDFRPLDKDLSVDVAVIGAGIKGGTAAFLLKRAGLKVALLEREKCGGVDSRHTTAHVTCVTDSRLHELVENTSSEAARAAWEAGQHALDFINQTCRQQEIDCDFQWVPGYLHASTRQ